MKLKLPSEPKDIYAYFFSTSLIYKYIVCVKIKKYFRGENEKKWPKKQLNGQNLHKEIIAFRHRYIFLKVLKNKTKINKRKHCR